ncbi:hypothetical protein VXN63_02130 [Marinilactibacillus sp. XAAS-LB27]|uniref:hypothetical protein n=1 Tax=Marinilactibacillus sp. XAAS-LB27 TaxID=3114538 RepID=UPI002E189098|nr:hypothetical protein [Marinilactibacillus sp. XAAS-LB27]
MNQIYQILAIAFSSGILGTIISVYFTRRTSKEENEIKMLDRLYKEIERLDAIVKTLRTSIEVLEGDKRDLRNQLDEAERQLSDARNELDQLKKSMEED